MIDHSGNQNDSNVMHFHEPMSASCQTRPFLDQRYFAISKRNFYYSLSAWFFMLFDSTVKKQEILRQKTIINQKEI
jgi:hypothetical protein